MSGAKAFIAASELPALGQTLFVGILLKRQLEKQNVVFGLPGGWPLPANGQAFTIENRGGDLHLTVSGEAVAQPVAPVADDLW